LKPQSLFISSQNPHAAQVDGANSSLFFANNFFWKLLSPFKIEIFSYFIGELRVIFKVASDFELEVLTQAVSFKILVSKLIPFSLAACKAFTFINLYSFVI